MFKEDMLRPNYLGLIAADARGLGPEVFYPPLNELGKTRLNNLKKQRDDFKTKYGKSLSFNLPDDECIKYELFTDNDVKSPYYKSKRKC